MNERTRKFVELVERMPWTPKLKRELFQKDVLTYLGVSSDEERFEMLKTGIFQRLRGVAKLHSDINTGNLGTINPAQAPFRIPKKKELMDIAAECVDKHATRYAFKCVHVEGSDIVATDGRILVRLENDGKYSDGAWEMVFAHNYTKSPENIKLLTWREVIPASFEVRTSAESLIDSMGKMIALENIDNESRVVLRMDGSEYVFIVQMLAMGIRAMLETGVEKGEMVVEFFKGGQKFTIMKLTAGKHYAIICGASIEEGMTRMDININ